MIFEGDQIFSNYGTEWFANKKFGEMMTRQQPNRDLLHIDDIHNRQGRRHGPKLSSDTQMVLAGEVVGEMKPISYRNIPGCTTKLTRYDTKTQTLRAAVPIAKGTYIEVARALLVPAFALMKPVPLAEFVWWNPHMELQSEDNEGEGQCAASADSATNHSCANNATTIHKYAIKPGQKLKKLENRHKLPDQIPPG